jgi:hypothetical protein
MIPKMGNPKINLENVTNFQCRKSVHQLTTFHHQITTTSPQITHPKTHQIPQNPQQKRALDHRPENCRNKEAR